EILVRSAGMCLGFLGDEDATRAAHIDGWWRTGDAGRLNERGELTVIGRMSRLARGDDGNHFAAEEIEAALRARRLVAEAVLAGPDDLSASVLIALDTDAVADWARTAGIGTTSVAELIAAPALRQLLRAELRARNDVLPPRFRLQRFALLEPG